MKISPTCTWGDGPDVCINLTRTDRERSAYTDPNFWAIDLTALEAVDLAANLVRCAMQAMQMDRELEAHERNGLTVETNNVVESYLRDAIRLASLIREDVTK